MQIGVRTNKKPPQANRSVLIRFLVRSTITLEAPYTTPYIATKKVKA